MTERILKILKEKGIDKYVIYDETRISYEMFFIKKKVDMTRSNNVKVATVTLLRDFAEGDKQYTGSTHVFIYPQNTDEEIAAIIDDAYASAMYVKNPYYELPKGSDAVMQYDGELSAKTLSDNAIRMAKALYEADVREDAFINSAELFSIRKIVKITSSNGADCSYEQYRIKGEYVTQSVINGNDVELYNSFEYDNPDCEALKKHCAEALSAAADRAVAEKAPKDLSGVPIILCNEALSSFMEFYLMRADSALIYPGYSDYKVGMDVCAGLSGEKPSFEVSSTTPFSNDGVLQTKREFLKDGVLQCIHGDNRFMYYLGKEQTGRFNRVHMSNKNATAEDFKKTPYVLVRYFSDFQMDEMDGHFGGEFRLATYFDGEKEHIITGGTVSGNILTASSMQYSEERYKDASYEGPKMIKINP